MGLSTPSELNIPYRSKLRDLLALVEGVEVFEPARVDECCGFGGMFAVEEKEVSVCMGHDKVRDHMSTGARVYHGGRQFVSDAHAGRHRPRTAADKDPAYR